MRIVHLFVALAILALAWPSPVRAVELRAEDLTPIALQATLDRQVPVLDLPVSGVRFLLVWKSGGRARVAELTSRRGRHAYEVRHLPGWSGPAEFVALSTFRGRPQDLGLLALPDTAAEWDMLSSRRQFLPIAVNRLDPEGFLGWSWNLILLGLGGVAALGFWLCKPRRENLAPALAVGDLRGLPGRHLLPSGLVDNQQVQMAREYSAWLDQVKKAMGDRPWDMDALPYPLDVQTRYLMAERPYRPGFAGNLVLTLREGQPAAYLRP